MLYWISISCVYLTRLVPTSLLYFKIVITRKSKKLSKITWKYLPPSIGVTGPHTPPCINSPIIFVQNSLFSNGDRVAFIYTSAQIEKILSDDGFTQAVPRYLSVFCARCLELSYTSGFALNMLSVVNTLRSVLFLHSNDVAMLSGLFLHNVSSQLSFRKIVVIRKCQLLKSF